jgi:hypothetical protein
LDLSFLQGCKSLELLDLSETKLYSGIDLSVFKTIRENGGKIPIIDITGTGMNTINVSPLAESPDRFRNMQCIRKDKSTTLYWGGKKL